MSNNDLMHGTKYGQSDKFIEPKNCKHERAYMFHENAPHYCPACDSYIRNYPSEFQEIIKE